MTATTRNLDDLRRQVRLTERELARMPRTYYPTAIHIDRVRELNRMRHALQRQLAATES